MTAPILSHLSVVQADSHRQKSILMQRNHGFQRFTGSLAMGILWATIGVCHAQTVIIHQNGTTTVVKGSGTVVVDSNGVVSVKRQTRCGKPLIDSNIISRHQITLNSDSQRRSYECDNSSVVINGNNDVLTLKGSCAEIVLNGNHDTVWVIGALRSVVQNGSGDVITWSKKFRRGTQIVDNGSNNSALYKP
jgi:hypothetical protein